MRPNSRWSKPLAGLQPTNWLLPITGLIIIISFTNKADPNSMNVCFQEG